MRSPLKAASVVVTTIMTATQSAHVRRLLAGGQFTLVAVDEAGFTPGRITLYMICSHVSTAIIFEHYSSVHFSVPAAIG